jgi:Cu(I)/Ag(I) efflux system periplasmic protein CusF
MKTHLLTAALAIAAFNPILVSPTQAQTTAPAAREMVDAEVKKVDKAGGKVTLKHAPMKSLDMPAMTMVFRVKDDTLWEKLVEGANVKIAAEKAILGYNVVAVEAVK